MSRRPRRRLLPEMVARGSGELFELLPCFDVSVSCSPEEMVARVRANAGFRGKLYTKDGPLDCSLDVADGLDFSLTIPLRQCGTLAKGDGEFSNVLVIQSNDHVMTAHDLALGLYCSYDLQNRTQHADVHVLSSDTTDTSRGHPPLPSLSLHVLDLQGAERESVALGELLRLQVRMSKEDTYGIFLRNLVAKDETGANNITLIDNSGCPIEARMMREVRTIDPHSKSLESYLEAFAFTGSSRLELEAEVETCIESCKPVLCQIATGRSEDDLENVLSYGRRRRRRNADWGHVLSSVKLRKQLSVRASLADTPPVTAPPLIGRPILLTRKEQHPGVVCFEPSLLTVAGGVFACVEVSLVTLCLVLGARWWRRDACCS